MIEFKIVAGHNIATGVWEEYDVHRITVDGRFVGYVTGGKNAAIMLQRPVSEAERYDIHQLVASRIGPSVSIIGPPKPPPPAYYKLMEEDNERA